MDNIDVELEALLKEDNSKADTASGASDQNSGSDKTSPDEAEMSPRAQERIRELLQENKKLKEQPKPQEQNWIDSIEDEGTRSLLKRTLEEADQRAESKFKPILSQFQDTQFEKTFSQFETAIPGLDRFKEEMRKEYERDPNMNVKSRIGEIIVDLQVNKIKPLETRAAQTPRDKSDIDLNAASKEDLYALLAQSRK